jgi:hypothetical protein
VLAYAAVIVYNLQNGLLGVAIVETKQTNVWQPAEAWTFLRARLSSPAVASAMPYAAGVLFVAVSLWPLITLFRYYDHKLATGQTNAYEMAFFQEFVQQWKGDKVLVSDTLGRFNATEYFLVVNCSAPRRSRRAL